MHFLKIAASSTPWRRTSRRRGVYEAARRCSSWLAGGAAARRLAAWAARDALAQTAAPGKLRRAAGARSAVPGAITMEKPTP